MKKVKALININVVGEIHGPGTEFEISDENYNKVKGYVEFLEEIEFVAEEPKIAYKNITADEIKGLLDEKGIEYDTDEKKELYELLYS